jgi:hypothetical protein
MVKLYKGPIYSPREAGVEVLKVFRSGSEIIIWDKVTKKLELWGHSQGHASAGIRYKGKDYEFIRSFR